MRDRNYYDTLIAVADDCPVAASVVPASKTAKPTVAALQYEMIAASPGALTQEDVLFDSWLARQDASHERSGADVQRMREDFFAKPQACLRASPLPKTHGWGLLFDSRGAVRLCAMESPEYRRLLAGDDVKVVKAMRSRRS